MKALLPALALVGVGACSGPLTDLRTSPEMAQPEFIPPGLQRVVAEPSGVRWQVVERRVFAQVGSSVDLWVQRAEPGSPFAEARFTGLVPSCFGRPRWVTDPDSGETRGACYLRRFAVQEGALLFQLRLGGDWTATLSVPLAEIQNDDDDDGWSNATEHLLGTQPVLADSDQDGVADPQDPNPLVSEQTGAGEETTPLHDMIQQVVAGSKACAAGKPLIVVGRDRLRRAFKDLRCTVLWRSMTEANIAQRTGAEEAAVGGGASALSLDVTAREGGLSRLIVEIDDGDPERPVATVYHLLGVERVVFVPSAGRFVEVKRSLELTAP